MNILDIAIAKKLAGGGGGSGTDNYNDLSNLPKINDTTLSGNKSSSALGLQSEINSESKLASDLVDDTNQDNKFVTSTEKNTWNEKQNAIDADHKINADYVDDSTSTNKFVTASDKETWNAKQNAIDNSHKLSSDLVDDANHTNKFVTSTEKQTWNAKQNAIDADHKLSSSLVSFSTAEAAALASGINSSKVDQISTNQTNILYAIQTGVKNTFNLLEWCDPGIYSTVNGLNARVMEDGRIHIYGTMTAQNNTDLSVKGSYASTVVVYTTPTSDSYTLSATTEGNVRNSELHFYSKNTGPYDDGINLTSGTDSKTLHAQNYTWLMVRVPATTSAVDFYVTPMVSLTSIGNTDFEPFALPNYDLTRLESEDRAALAEEIDAGAKNMLNFDLTSLKALNTSGTWSGNSYTSNGVTFTYNDSTKTISTYGTSTPGNTIFYLMNFTPTSGKSFTISGCPSGGSSSGYRFCNMGQTWANDYGSSDTAVGDGTSKEIAIYINNSGTAVGTSSNPLTWKPMICTKAAFCLSPKFVPYRPSYDTIASTYLTKCNTAVVNSGSLDDVSTNTIAYYSNNVSGLPSGVSGYAICETTVFDANVMVQKLYMIDGVYNAFIRMKQTGTWRAWKQITNT